ncbi:MAG: ABC transporter ATP-binding protein [Peptostreptococcus sp.]|uniref:ABC transporter ATP-binding protein n=1 Tax=Peptostreptococcus sp. TaxID=1262 RepID=UPI002FC6B52A
METEKILTVENLTKVFYKKNGEAHTAVDGVSFDLFKGEIFSFLGPNGAGKSTTINMLTTQLSTTGGEIYFQGTSLHDNPIYARSKVGIVAQHNNLDRGLTAIENLIYHGIYFGMSKSDAKKRAEELLKDFGLTDWKNEYVKSFSGGMAQRLKIARAIMHRPDILFLDEPTTGLDPAYREVLWEHVLRLKNEYQTTVFLTTHYMEEPERFSDRVAIYNKGKIKAIGTVEELRKLVPSESIVTLQLEELPPLAMKEILLLDGVNNVSQKDEKTLIVYVSESKSILNRLINWVEERKLILENINLSTTTLDDIFIYLTNDKKEN